MNNRNIRRSLLVAACLCLPLAVFAQSGGTGIRSVILLIPDGMSVDGVTLARWYRGGAPLALDALACGLVRTYSSDAAIADSAPAATAMATGFKSHTGYIGVLPDVADMPGQRPIRQGEEKRPVASVLETAHLAGKAAGLIATSELMHATPAAFASHDPSRKNYDALSEQMLHNRVEVLLGGGRKFFQPSARKDGEDLLAEARKLGYTLVATPAELAALKPAAGQKVLGLFAPEALAYDFDRDPAKEPSLAEMTRKALEILSLDPDGFFLMVEGSKVDWAAHANDPVGIVSDVLAFDAAVAEALAFAEKDGRTALLAVSDHGNSGLTIGDRSTSTTYDKHALAFFLDPLKKARRTGEGLESLLAADRANAGQVLAEYYGVSDLSAEELKAVKEAKAGSLNYTVGPMIAARARLGFTTTGHTGEDVVLYAYDPSGNRPTGLVENSDLALIMARYLGVRLWRTTDRLFLEASAAFKAKGATVGEDKTDPNNPMLVVRKGATEVRLPQNKGYALAGGKNIPLEGVTVFNGERWYVGQRAVDLIP
jgi:alkaline phosphatase